MHAISDLDHTLAANLDALVKDDAFALLSKELNRFTPFRVLRVERYELRHTNTLAWLLDPFGSHGMGPAFLDRFLEQVLGSHAPLASPLVEIRTELVLSPSGKLVEDSEPPGDDVNTRDRLDILVEGRTADRRTWVLAIEAKIDSQEGAAQLQRYDDALQRLFPQVDVAKCYLTLGPAENVSSPHWRPVYWGRHVSDALRGALTACTELDGRVRDFLEDYQALIDGLSSQEAAGTDKAALANSARYAPALRVLNERIKDLDGVHSWDAVPWASTYRLHKTVLDACRRVVREKGAILVWSVIDDILEDTTRWERITTASSKTLRVRFIPRSWTVVEGLKTDGQWNLFYQAEFRKTHGDIEIKLYVAPPGDAAVQKILLQRIFGENLQLRPADALTPDLKKLHDFVWGSGQSIKLWRHFIVWREEQDGTLLAGQLDADKRAFEQAVARHTAVMLEGLGDPAP
ncbi:PD-(D/E)XK nuclease family protein [Massilia sp. HP4]|uniref:PDDEXK-like family protein n=1 Tax=Massilia sp. HP4 TaxID=2562316 RepID=UPI00148579BC|nr:PD-(D/E)XK nuclease family protein [Massilia sp. HP4]